MVKSGRGNFSGADCRFPGILALFLILRVSSLQIGNGTLWILRWQNDASGSGIRFNLVPLLMIAIIVGEQRWLIKLRSDRYKSQNIIISFS